MRSASLLVVVLVVLACQTTPVTGRSQLNLLSTDQEMQLGAQAYDEMLAKEKLITSGPQYDMVKRVAERLIAVGRTEGDGAKYEWQYRLIDNDKIINASCLPGGKMVVYSGILPVTQNEAGLAVVLGHEISHALARHGNERVSTSQALDVALGVLGSAAGAIGKLDESHQQLLMTALGAGAQYGAVLPWGRKQESEADHIGLILMARAGYDPHEAIKFWERMQQFTGSDQPPEFLSTHPSHATRIKDLTGWIPEATAAAKQEAEKPRAR